MPYIKKLSFAVVFAAIVGLVGGPGCAWLKSFVGDAGECMKEAAKEAEVLPAVRRALERPTVDNALAELGKLAGRFGRDVIDCMVARVRSELRGTDEAAATINRNAAAWLAQ